MVDSTAWDDGERRTPDFNRAERLDLPAAPAAHRTVSGQMMTRLMRVIEGEIVPRLVSALQSSPAQGSDLSELSVAEVEEFAKLVAAQDVSIATAYINALLNRGVSLEHIYLNLLAPAARLLGDWWKTDSRDFSEVTSGLCRMHQLLHEFSPLFLHEASAAQPNKSILLMPMPGEQHSFGLIMVAEFFRRAGWDVWDLHPSTVEEVLDVLGKQWFAVVGISASCESKMDQLAPLISAARAKSRNRSVGVMVGGQPFINHPELVVRIGADCTAGDGRGAPLRAERLVDALRHPALDRT